MGTTYLLLVKVQHKSDNMINGPMPEPEQVAAQVQNILNHATATDDTLAWVVTGVIA